MKLTYMNNKSNLCPICGKELLLCKDKWICTSFLLGVCDFTLLEKETLINKIINKILASLKKHSFLNIKTYELLSLFKFKNDYNSELEKNLKLNLKNNKYYNSLLVYNNIDEKINKKISLNIDIKNRNIIRENNRVAKQYKLPIKDLNYINTKFKH